MIEIKHPLHQETLYDIKFLFDFAPEYKYIYGIHVRAHGFYRSKHTYPSYASLRLTTYRRGNTESLMQRVLNRCKLNKIHTVEVFYRSKTRG